MTSPRFPTALVASLGFIVSCGEQGSSTKGKTLDSAVPKPGSVAPALSRAATVSDLFLPYPLVDTLTVTSEESGRLTLADLVGNENATAVVRHMTLKSTMGPLDKDETREAERFWNVNPSSPAFTPVMRGEPAYRKCLEDPKNLTVRAIRFAPFESSLPGAPLIGAPHFPMRTSNGESNCVSSCRRTAISTTLQLT